MATRQERIAKAWEILSKNVDGDLETADEMRSRLSSMYGSWENVPENHKKKVRSLESKKRPTKSTEASPTDFSQVMFSEPSMMEAEETEPPTVEGTITAPKTTQRIGADGQPEAVSLTEIMDDPVRASTTMEGSEASVDAMTEKGAGINGMQLGTMIGAVSSANASLTNLLINAFDRPEKEKNPFVTYAQDSLQKLDEMERFASGVRDLKLGDLALAETGQTASNRLAARGMGTLRALDLSTHLAGLGERRKIESEYMRDVSGIKDKQAQTMLDRDRVVMTGEERRVEREMMNRDAYKTNLSQSIMDLGTTGQHIGGQMNKERSSEMGWRIAGGSGKYGGFQDYWSWLNRQTT